LFNFFSIATFMTDPPIDLARCLPTRSTVLTRVPPDIRRFVNQAILDHLLPTLRRIYTTYSLDTYNVSFTAFYYYARRLRTCAALSELHKLRLPAGHDARQLLPETLAQRLLEAALHPRATSRGIARLAHAYRMVNQANIARARFDAFLEDREAAREAATTLRPALPDSESGTVVI
jgi:hypothetical protein